MMKKSFYIFIFSVLCLGLSAQTKPKTTVIFIDKSSSSVDDPAVLERMQDDLSETVWSATEIDGSQVIIAYIYENSASVSNQQVFRYEAPKLDESRFVGSELDYQRDLLEDAVLEERTYFTEMVVEKALAYTPDRPATHILSALSLIESWQRQYGSLELVFFSDMIEASKEFRYLASTKFENVEHAGNLGRADAKKVASVYGLKSNFLRGVSVTVFLPVQDMDNREVFRFISAYWNGVFSSFGLSSSHLKFQ